MAPLLLNALRPPGLRSHMVSEQRKRTHAFKATACSAVSPAPQSAVLSSYQTPAAQFSAFRASPTIESAAFTAPPSAVLPSTQVLKISALPATPSAPQSVSCGLSPAILTFNPKCMHQAPSFTHLQPSSAQHSLYKFVAHSAISLDAHRMSTNELRIPSVKNLVPTCSPSSIETWNNKECKSTLMQSGESRSLQTGALMRMQHQQVLKQASAPIVHSSSPATALAAEATQACALQQHVLFPMRHTSTHATVLATATHGDSLLDMKASTRPTAHSKSTLMMASNEAATLQQQQQKPPHAVALPLHFLQLHCFFHALISQALYNLHQTSNNHENTHACDMIHSANASIDSLHDISYAICLTFQYAFSWMMLPLFAYFNNDSQQSICPSYLLHQFAKALNVLHHVNILHIIIKSMHPLASSFTSSTKPMSYLQGYSPRALYASTPIMHQSIHNKFDLFILDLIIINKLPKAKNYSSIFPGEGKYVESQVVAQVKAQATQCSPISVALLQPSKDEPRVKMKASFFLYTIHVPFDPG